MNNENVILPDQPSEASYNRLEQIQRPTAGNYTERPWIT